MFIITIIIFIPITQQPVHDRLAENQPTAGLSSLNEYGEIIAHGLMKGFFRTFIPKKHSVKLYWVMIGCQKPKVGQNFPVINSFPCGKCQDFLLLFTEVHLK